MLEARHSYRKPEVFGVFFNQSAIERGAGSDECSCTSSVKYAAGVKRFRVTSAHDWQQTAIT